MMIDLDQAVSQAQFGRLVGISPQAVGLLTQRGTLRRGGTAAEWLLAYCASLRAAASGRASDAGVSAARARLLVAQAERTELEHRRRLGQLVDVAAADRKYGGLMMHGAAKLDVLPQRVIPTIRAATSDRVAMDLLRQGAAPGPDRDGAGGTRRHGAAAAMTDRASLVADFLAGRDDAEAVELVREALRQWVESDGLIPRCSGISAAGVHRNSVVPAAIDGCGKRHDIQRTLQRWRWPSDASIGSPGADAAVPPAAASEVEHALHHARAAGLLLPTSTKHLARIVDADSPKHVQSIAA